MNTLGGKISKQWIMFYIVITLSDNFFLEFRRNFFIAFKDPEYRRLSCWTLAYIFFSNPCIGSFLNFYFFSKTFRHTQVYTVTFPCLKYILHAYFTVFFCFTHVNPLSHHLAVLQLRRMKTTAHFPASYIYPRK